MNAFQNQAPTIDDALSLEVHELGFLLLRKMQKRTELQAAGNWFMELARLYDPPIHSHEPPPKRGKEFALAVGEAIAWLTSNGLVATYYDGNYTKLFVTRRGRSVDSEDAFRLFLHETALDPVALHPTIRAEAWPLYVRGKFDAAVFESFKRVEIAVRNATTLSGFYGPDLMRKAFHAENGPLADKSLPVGERESIMHLFHGAIGAFKNPGSHREVGLDDPTRAAELLMFASHLLRIVDDRVAALSAASAS
jgi:uncharacterized protein (TIGR02391 family)